MPLYIMHNSEDGLRIEVIERNKFQDWYKENFDGVKPEYLPKFVTAVPKATTPTDHYLIIAGDIIIPKPIQVVTEYVLEDKK